MILKGWNDTAVGFAHLETTRKNHVSDIALGYDIFFSDLTDGFAGLDSTLKIDAFVWVEFGNGQTGTAFDEGFVFLKELFHCDDISATLVGERGGKIGEEVVAKVVVRHYQNVILKVLPFFRWIMLSSNSQQDL